MDVNKIRKGFPILDTGIIYFDNAASSLTPDLVLEKMMEYYHQYRANIERGVHRLSQRASEEYEEARRKVSNFINAKSADEIVMTRNTTEGINVVANGLDWKKGDKVVTTSIEHHSNFTVWLEVRRRFGVDLRIVLSDKSGLFNLNDFEKAIDDDTKLVAVTHVSNVLGTITPVEEIVKISRDHGALILIDGAQSVPHMKVDVQKIGCDFLAFSGHKMCAPTGTGVLYLKEENLSKVKPSLFGGGMVKGCGFDSYEPTKAPQRFEAGTPAIAEVIGLGAAVDYLNGIGMDDIERHERQLAEKLYNGLRGVRGVEVYGPDPAHRTGVFSFNIGELSPHDVALAFDISANIMIRSGFHCAMPLITQLLRLPSGTARASLYLYNTDSEVEKFLATASEIASSLT